MLRGKVIRFQSGFYYVQADDKLLTCHLRGRLKRGRARGDLVAVGDWVQIALQPDGLAMIEAIEERKSALVRLAPTPRGEYQQILLANADQVMLVFACAQPQPHLRMLDRFLVICEKQQVPVVIVANKVDLVGLPKAREMFAAYEQLGYTVIHTSAAQRIGLDELHQSLIGKLSGFAGPSGVGKSSLLNAVQPDLGLAVRDVARQTTKGTHTTVVRELFALKEGVYVVDLPGLKSLALWDTHPEELDGYFRELAPLVEICQFNDCTHRNEPGCAVRKAIADGKVREERYQSYLRLRYGDKE